MPTVALRFCSRPGCGVRVARGECQQHRKERRQRDDARRKGAAHRAVYQTPTWTRLKALVLSEHPVCQQCERNLSSVVDHVKPISAGGAEYDRENLQALCASCHNRKTRCEQNAGLV
jgi:5-methylcytosine-specific restriction enzyme A